MHTFKYNKKYIPVSMTIKLSNPSVCEDADIMMYADDTVLYTYGKSAIEVTTKLSWTWLVTDYNKCNPVLKVLNLRRFLR